MRTFVLRHPLAGYFGLTFVISWGGLLLAAGGPAGIPATLEQVEGGMPVFVLAMLAGPSLAGVILTALKRGRDGLGDLLSRLSRWRVGGRWYALALLTAPVVMMVLLLALSRAMPELLPGFLATDDRAGLLRFGIVVALGAGFFEELGWTGFAIPEMRRRQDVLETGLLVGLVWAAWHVLPALWLSGMVSGDLALTSYLLDPFLFLVAFRVLMVWVYERTGSLLLAMLMHASLTGSARIVGAQAVAGVPLITFDVVWALVLWGVVVSVVGGRKLTRPLPA